MFRTLTGFALALFLAAPASASPFTWLVEGQITNLPNQGWGTPYDGEFSIGQPFSLWLTMESTSPDYYPDPGCGAYSPITAMRFASGSVSFSISAGFGGEYFVSPAGSNSCEIPEGLARVRSGFGANLFFGMHFSGNFVTDALPVSTAGIGFTSFDLAYLGPPGGDFGGIAIANGSITSITNVPEPAELLLLAGGVLAALRRVRRAMGREKKVQMT
jgi:hypothetical protein